MIVLFIVLYIVYAILLFLIHQPLYLSLISLPVLLLYIRLPARAIKRGLGITLLFGLFIFLGNQLNPEGKIIFEKKFIILADDSMRLGLERTMRVMLLIMAAKVLLWRFSPDELLKGIETLLGPLARKKAVKGFIETGLLTIKALPGVKRELQRLYTERCKEGNLVQRLRAISFIIITVLTKAINSPEEFF